jgi:hypothetical protein
MESIIKTKWDKVWVGIAMGLIASVATYFLSAGIWAFLNDRTIHDFYLDIFAGFEGYFTSKIITLCVLSNVVLFYIFLKKNFMNLCKGLLAVLVITVPVIIYFY